jgi:hypothetical protein
MVKKQELEKEDSTYWKKAYEDLQRQIGTMQGQIEVQRKQMLDLQTLYNDKMSEINDFGFLMMQFSREKLTKAQKEELAKKLAMINVPTSSVQQPVEILEATRE